MKYKLRTIVQPKALTFYLKNKTIEYSSTYTFADNHPNFAKAKAWLQEVQGTDLYQDRGRILDVKYAELRKLYDVASAINSWSDGDLKITRTGTLYKGSAIPQAISDMLVKAFFADPTNDEAFKAWSTYLGIATDPNLSSKIIDRLFLFLSKNDLNITSDGKVLAWKVVRPDYLDKHSRTFDNSVGKVLEMPRNKVNDNDAQHCSYGFHVCSWGYLDHFAQHGDPVMQVEVDIKDIVSIPTDYNGEKVRVCKYKVVAEAGVWGKTVDAKKLPKHAGLGFTAKA